MEDRFDSLNLSIDKPDSVKDIHEDPDLISGQKKHARTKFKLDSWFQNLIHPFTLTLFGVVFFVIFLFFRYLSIIKPNDVITSIYADLEGSIGYVATAVLSSIITEFIQMLRKQ